MQRITLVLADKDVEYIELFKRYIRQTEYEKKFIIKSFSSKENLEQYLLSENDCEILLIDSKLSLDNLLLFNINSIILLSETDIISEKLHLPVIYKYQPLNKLISQILGLYLETFKGKEIIDGYNTKVISIYSASGGSGKTTTAVNIAKQLTLRDNKVFYLNFELITSVEVFFSNSGSYDLSKILYYLKNNPSMVVSKIESFKEYDIDTKVDYLEPFVNPIEIFDLTYDDVKILIESIKKLGVYNYIIIDLDISLQEYVLGALTESDYVIWLVIDDIQSILKTKTAKKILENLLKEQYLTLISKIRIVLNKYLETGTQNDFSNADIDLFSYLPYIPDWKVITSKNQLLFNDLFINKIDNLLQSVLND